MLLLWEPLESDGGWRFLSVDLTRKSENCGGLQWEHYNAKGSLEPKFGLSVLGYVTFANVSEASGRDSGAEENTGV